MVTSTTSIEVLAAEATQLRNAVASLYERASASTGLSTYEHQTMRELLGSSRVLLGVVADTLAIVCNYRGRFPDDGREWERKEAL